MAGTDPACDGMSLTFGFGARPELARYIAYITWILSTKSVCQFGGHDERYFFLERYENVRRCSVKIYFSGIRVFNIVHFGVESFS